MIMMAGNKELLATASLDRCIRVWDVATDGGPRCVHTLGPPKVGVAPHGRHVPSANECDVLRCHERGVTCLAFSAHHRHLFSGGLDHELLVWNPLSERVICNLRMHTSPLTAIEAVQKTSMVVSADGSGMVCVWDCRSLSCAQKLTVSVPSGIPRQSNVNLCMHRYMALTWSLVRSPLVAQVWSSRACASSLRTIRS